MSAPRRGLSALPQTHVDELRRVLAVHCEHPGWVLSDLRRWLSTASREQALTVRARVVLQVTANVVDSLVGRIGAPPRGVAR